MNILIHYFKNNVTIKSCDYTNSSKKDKIDFHFYKIKQVKKRETSFSKEAIKNYIIIELNYIRILKGKNRLNFI